MLIQPASNEVVLKNMVATIVNNLDYNPYYTDRFIPEFEADFKKAKDLIEFRHPTRLSTGEMLALIGYSSS